MKALRRASRLRSTDIHRPNDREQAGDGAGRVADDGRGGEVGGDAGRQPEEHGLQGGQRHGRRVEVELEATAGRRVLEADRELAGQARRARLQALAGRALVERVARGARGQQVPGADAGDHDGPDEHDEPGLGGAHGAASRSGASASSAASSV